MVRYLTAEKKVRVSKVYHKFEPTRRVRRKFILKYPNPPSRQAVGKLVKNVETTESVLIVKNPTL